MTAGTISSISLTDSFLKKTYDTRRFHKEAHF